MVNRWTQYEVEVLEVGYCLGYKLDDIAQTLSKTKQAVSKKAQYLNLKRPKKINKD